MISLALPSHLTPLSILSFHRFVVASKITILKFGNRSRHYFRYHCALFTTRYTCAHRYKLTQRGTAITLKRKSETVKLGVLSLHLNQIFPCMRIIKRDTFVCFESFCMLSLFSLLSTGNHDESMENRKENERTFFFYPNAIS